MKSDEKRRISKRAGLTLIEVLAATFIAALASVAYYTVPKSHGIIIRIGVASIGGAVGLAIVAHFIRWSSKRDKERLRKLSADYRGIYRVLVVPQDNQPAVMLVGAEIRVRDYGWEAPPLTNAKDGLIYLQGLTPDWRTVWHAGFRPDQIERTGPKPSSQYEHWAPDWVRKMVPDPCPFPIQPRETPSMNCPHHSERYGWAYPQPRIGKMVRVKKH